MSATTSGGKMILIGYSTKRYVTKSRMRSPISDQASNPHRAARATKGFERKGPRSLSIRCSSSDARPGGADDPLIIWRAISGTVEEVRSFKSDPGVAFLDRARRLATLD